MRYQHWRLRSRIASATILLLVSTIALLAVALFSLLQETYMERLEEGIVGQVHLTALLLMPPHQRDASPPGLQTTADTLHTLLAARVTFLDAEGLILADSLQPTSVRTSLAERPEVRAALQGLQGANTRQNVATGDDMLYIAVPVGDPTTFVRIVRIGVPLTTITAATRRLALTVFAIALGAALIALLLALMIARRVTHPLLELRTMAGALAAGDLTVQVPVPREEEVAALAHDFNQMAHRLRDLVLSREREQQRLTTILTTMADGLLIVDQDELVILANHTALQLFPHTQHLPCPLRTLPIGEALLPQLAAASQDVLVVLERLQLSTPARSLRVLMTCLPPPDNGHRLLVFQDLTDLRRAEDVRRTFLTNISHDLRTPLTSIQIMLDALEDGALEERSIAEDFIRRMQAETQSLKHLMHDFFELSRMESGQLAFHYTPISLHTFAPPLLDRMRVQAQHQNLLLQLDIPSELPQVMIDLGRIEQVILNLLQNALKFTPSGGVIWLRARAQPDGIQVDVEDTGQGIPPDDLPHIFERFYKGDRSRQREGTGLGLAIAKQIIERHGGSIWAHSIVQQGTTISFFLPLSQPSDVLPPLT